MNDKLIIGKIEGNERGYAFLIPENGGEDYFISYSDLCGALHGDIVVAKKKDATGKRTTARVTEIKQRGIKKIVGTFQAVKSGGFVICDDKKFFEDVYVPYKLSKKAKTGDKVVCEINFYPKGTNPEGEIVEILGRQFNRNTEVKSICIANGIDIPFRKETIKACELLSSEISEKEIKLRRDFRNDITVTIDGEDAKDFDDAICVKLLDNGDFLLGVHIADVSHYVTENSVIDAEAYNRGTSVYFPELVVPMLPERLCNDLCSLKEGVDRLTLSCIMRVNKNGEVIDNEIVPSIIRSKARMTYTEVFAILNGDENASKKYDENIIKMLKYADTLCGILMNKRDERGSIDLDVKEAQITINKGKVEIYERERNRAHKMIEEFMILANETVAEYAFYLNLPFIYRIHEKPTVEKMERLTEFLKGLGVNRKWHIDNVYPKDFQSLLALFETERKNLAPMVNRVTLRSMQKAKYYPENEGHFGLSSKCYCHFTSPIRRYPDLVVHRILKYFLSGNQDAEEKFSDFVYSASSQSGNKERSAETAERAVDDYYKILYLSDKIGQEFKGVISGVQNFGFFVELPNTAEGIVKIDTLLGKDYKFDEKNFKLYNSKNCYKLGQEVEIIVANADLTNKRAEFMLKDSYLRLTKNMRVVK